MNDIEKAVILLKQGKLVAFPTETVYGLGADATNPEAVRKIFAAKQRPVDHPLIVHIASLDHLVRWARVIPDSAWQLANVFWPGPLTLILKKAPSVSDLVTGTQDTIGIRIPHHPIAQALLQAFNGGLAAPSANRFGRISPTTAEAVQEELGNAVDLILAGGQCEVGVESTIVDVSGEDPVILRPGMITQAEIEAVLQRTLAIKKKTSPRTSGMHAMHYAPETFTQLMTTGALTHFLSQSISGRIACVTYNPFTVPEGVVHVVMPKNAKQYAQKLYRVLRELDKEKFQQIIVEDVPEDKSWDAIRDRLQRAANSNTSFSRLRKKGE